MRSGSSDIRRTDPVTCLFRTYYTHTQLDAQLDTRLFFANVDFRTNECLSSWSVTLTLRAGTKQFWKIHVSPGGLFGVWSPHKTHGSKPYTFNSPHLLLQPHGHGRWKADRLTGEADAQTELALGVKFKVTNKRHEGGVCC